MTNPFLRSIAGVFIATTEPSGNPTMAERLCAALARAIASEPAKALDPAWWSYAVNQVPQLAPGAITRGTVSVADASALASVCLGSAITKDVPQAQGALTQWIETIPQPAVLNSLTVALGAASLMNVSLTFIGCDKANGGQAVSFRRTEMLLNCKSQTIAAGLQDLFGMTAPLSQEPYYCRI
ncbi:MAG: hypothetical protein AB7N91_15165 [Candidatus Tectimicrobiota bacterium]